MNLPSEGTRKRMKCLNTSDHERDKSETGSGFGSRRDRWLGCAMVYPSNVLTISPTTHGASGNIS
jgi:hypothetical protein